MTEKPGKLQPALIGGLIGGLLLVVPSLISHFLLPLFSYVNIGCCLWGLIGGVVAARALIKRSPLFRVTNGEGAVVGLLAGVFASIIMIVVNTPLTLERWDLTLQAIKQAAAGQNDPAAQESMNNLIAFLQNNPVVSALMLWLIFAVVVIGMAMLGGVIGAAMFEKRKGETYPPQGPPPDYPPSDFTPPGPPTTPSGQAPY